MDPSVDRLLEVLEWLFYYFQITPRIFLQTHLRYNNDTITHPSEHSPFHEDGFECLSQVKVSECIITLLNKNFTCRVISTIFNYT